MFVACAVFVLFVSHFSFSQLMNPNMPNMFGGPGNIPGLPNAPQGNPAQQQQHHPAGNLQDQVGQTFAGFGAATQFGMPPMGFGMGMNPAQMNPMLNPMLNPMMNMQNPYGGGMNFPPWMMPQMMPAFNPYMGYPQQPPMMPSPAAPRRSERYEGPDDDSDGEETPSRSRRPPRKDKGRQRDRANERADTADSSNVDWDGRTAPADAQPDMAEMLKRQLEEMRREVRHPREHPPNPLFHRLID